MKLFFKRYKNYFLTWIYFLSHVIKFREKFKILEKIDSCRVKSPNASKRDERRLYSDDLKCDFDHNSVVKNLRIFKEAFLLHCQKG